MPAQSAPAGDSKVRRAALALVVSSAAMAALAIFQWLELLRVRRGGSAICTVNETINCEAVWNSVLADRVHEAFHVPVAGLGLVWGLTALLHAVRLWMRSQRGLVIAPVVPVVRIVSAVGVLACIGFVYASAQTHALCLTCLATYLLVLVFAVVAFRGFREPLFAPEQIGQAIVWTAGTVVVLYLLALAPGLATPRASAIALPAGATPTSAQASQSAGANQAQLTAFFASLAPQEKAALIAALKSYRRATPPLGALAFAPRTAVGDPRAPMHIVDFTDVKCPHCRHLEEALKMLRASLPPGTLAVESRYFPLDPECNPTVSPGMGSAVRCQAAKAQLCLDQTPELTDLQEKLFSEQDTLTSERVLQIASSGSMKREALEACMASPETAERLSDDIKLAKIYGIEGTPLVIVNGRSAGTPFPFFLYVLALSDVNPDAALAVLDPSAN